MDIVVEIKINTTREKVTPLSIMEATKYEIESIKSDVTHKVLDWRLLEINR